ncbi:hypothetical protein CKM354_000458700 [Cercospora kikuchii]|uniref:Cell wall glycoprotein n=1 Tax=Cercospora kikuchii TaxID=84275 RepID=A0A9P3CK71_9PEZI|nr:uncharacterized protein CKM354_000458700 [Cercospora kikuchii]GIZ41275.1 hypothetical protein CKM354_000458700 [Cercospora kikuchii]
MKYTIFAAIIGLASAASYGAPDAKTCDCYFKYRECQGGPDANQSFCASQFAGCANYNPFTGEEAAPYFANLQANCKATTSAPGGYPTAPPTYGASSSAPAPTYPAGKPDAKTCECYAKLGQCQTGPNANQATCAAEFASCANYNPYTGDSATAYFDNLKKNCPTSSAPAPSSTPTAPGKPDAKTCECYAKLGQCQTAPNANQATCAAEFASCSGNNPYTGDDRATAYFDNLKKNCPAGGPTTPSSAPKPSGTPTGPTGKPDAKVCACYDQANKCRVGPQANQSFCSSQFASCAGYNPYTGDTAATTAYFDNLAKNCPTGGAPSGTSPAGTKPVAYPTATNNHTITTYTGAASHARVGAGALAAGMAAMLVL